MWAICLSCERRAGRSLTSGWVIVLGWILVPFALMAAAWIVLSLLFG